MSNTVLLSYDITLHEGTTYDKEFQWTIEDVIVSLFGITGIMQIRRSIFDDDPLIDLPFQSDPWIADGDSGIYLSNIGTDDKYRIYINNTDASNLCESHTNINGTYNLFLYNDSNECILKQYGVALIVAAVARPIVII